MLLASLALAADPVLLVRVVDAAGKPVPNAEVTFAGEGDRHRVEGEGGTWRGDTLAGERIGRAETVRVYVSAPGYAAKAVDARIRERRGNELTVTLDARAPAGGGTDPAKAALAAEKAWIDAEALRFENPTQHNAGVALQARAALANAASAWLATKPTGEELATARSLCIAAAEKPEGCDTER